MIAVDTNVLVHAHRRDSAFHPQAAARLRELGEAPTGWAIPWHCLREFYAVVTHPRVFSPASTPTEALTQIDSWSSSPSLVLLGETASYLQMWRDLLTQGHVVGPKAHDAHIAALCLCNGVRELLTHDRDFSRFPQLRTRSLLA